MSDQATSLIELDWPSDADLRQVGTLVLGGVAARTDAPIDRVEELGLALESLARRIGNGRVRLEIEVGEDSLAVSVGPFSDDPLADDGIRRVVRGLVDDASTARREQDHWVHLGLALTRG